LTITQINDRILDIFEEWEECMDILEQFVEDRFGFMRCLQRYVDMKTWYFGTMWPCRVKIEAGIKQITNLIQHMNKIEPSHKEIHDEWYRYFV